MASLQKKNGKWYIVYYVNGKQKWANTKQIYKANALKILQEFESEQGFKKFGLNKKKISLEQFVGEYFLPHCEATKAPNTYKACVLSVKYFKEFFGNILLSDIDYSLIEDYKVWRKKTGVTNRSINRELMCLRPLLRQARDRSYIAENPMEQVKSLREDKKIPKFLTREEIIKLLDNASPYLRPLVILAINTGLRHGELLNLRWEDVDWDRGTVKIAISSNYKPKNRKERIMGLNEEAYKVLRFLHDYWIHPSRNLIYPRESSQMDYIICNRKGKPFKSLKTALKNAVKKAGLQGITWHTLRHTWASHAIMAGISPSVVQRGLGHSNISTTNIYMHLAPQYFLNTVRGLDLGQNIRYILETKENKEIEPIEFLAIEGEKRRCSSAGRATHS